MQQDAADTNPFKKLAEQERERERLSLEKKKDQKKESPSSGTVQETADSNSLAAKHGNLPTQFRPPIPVAPILIGQNSASSVQLQNDRNQRLPPLETSDTSTIHSRPIIETTSHNTGQESLQTGLSPRSANEESGDDYSNFVDSYADSNSENDSDSDSSSSSEEEVLQPIDSSTLQRLIPQVSAEETPVGNRLEHQSISSSQSANGRKVPITETVTNGSPHASATATGSHEVQLQHPYPPEPPARTNLAPSLLQPSPVNRQSFPENSFISIDSPVLENSSNLLNFDQYSTPAAPLPPLRPLQSRQSSSSTRNRVSSLDPGSSSDIPIHSYYGEYGAPSTSHREDDQIRPIPTQNFEDLTHSPKLPKRPTTSTTSANLSLDSSVQNYHYSPHDDTRRFSRGYGIDPNRSESDLTPIVSTPVLTPVATEPFNAQSHIKENYSLHNNTAPILSSQNHSVAELPAQGSPYREHPELRASLPIITVSTPDNDTPRLPQKPQLPKRPPRLSSGSASAYELLENFGRRSSSTANPDRPKIAFQASPNAPIDDLDMESLRSLGITEEMIRQQKEIEERIQRENLRERELRNQLIQQERLENNHANSTIPSNNTGGQSMSNISMSSEISNGHISNDSHESDEMPDDISQLEIPTNISRTTSTSIDNASEVQSAISSSPSSTDLFVNEELTEEEFLSLLPPVPQYTPTASETEISIPNGKAIDMMTINENHPVEKPPEYSPVSDALKKIINRPQFSQTGGDSLSLRRRQQQEQHQQHQHHHHHTNSNGQQLSTSSRHRSGSGTSTRRTSSRSTVQPIRTTTRRLPPTSSISRYSN